MFRGSKVLKVKEAPGVNKVHSAKKVFRVGKVLKEEMTDRASGAARQSQRAESAAIAAQGAAEMPPALSADLLLGRLRGYKKLGEQ